jgi:hypothetical protein
LRDASEYSAGSGGGGSLPCACAARGTVAATVAANMAAQSVEQEMDRIGSAGTVRVPILASYGARA